MTDTDRASLMQVTDLLTRLALRIRAIEDKQERMVQVLKKLSEDVTELKNAPKHEYKGAGSGTKRRGRQARKETEPVPASEDAKADL